MYRAHHLGLLIAALAYTSSPLHAAQAKRPHEKHFSGRASYYSTGQRVASGGKFDPTKLTCAHRTLPFGTRLRVTDPRTGKSVIVTVNDRGPFIKGRVLDVSLAAAKILGMVERGIMEFVAEITAHEPPPSTVTTAREEGQPVSALD